MAFLQAFFPYFVLALIVTCMRVQPTFADLKSDFYDEVCPEALPTIKLMVEEAITLEPRMGASLLRLHFHDCFVNGCDASILLDDTLTFTGEKTAGPNNNSLRGYDVIDEIKSALNTVCLDNVVSCADIVAVAARDSVVAMATDNYLACVEILYELGGADYQVLLGRRDSTTASIDAANDNIPSPSLSFPDLLSNFQALGLSLTDLVVLSGAHTIGFARCLIFRSRIYNNTSSSIDPSYATNLQDGCPQDPGDGYDNLAGLDGSALSFDKTYFSNLVQKKGLLESDQQLYQGDGGDADKLVEYYSENVEAFWTDFGAAMVKMGSLSPLTGSDGVIRVDCRVVS